MAEPPVEAGAVKLTLADPFPGVAVTPVGAVGAPTVIAVDAEDGVLVPLALVAVTVNV